jgi:hypothetical protein
VTYKWSDGWVLLAILYAGRDQGADVTDIVACADGIEHAILTYGELQNALFKLTAGGLVRYANGRFTPTATATAFIDSVSKKGRRVAADLDDIQRFLAAEPWAPGPAQFRQEHSFPAVTPEDFEAAVRQYLERARKALRPERPKKRKRVPRS